MDDDVFVETDQVNEAEKEFIRNCIYRQDLLNIFELEIFDEAVINNFINQIYEKTKTIDAFTKCILKVDEQMGVDDKTGLTLLYSFDYLYLTHICICELLETGQISIDNINSLHKAINQ